MGDIYYYSWISMHNDIVISVWKCTELLFMLNNNFASMKSEINEKNNGNSIK